jgi:hypothetical protein
LASFLYSEGQSYEELCFKRLDFGGRPGSRRACLGADTIEPVFSWRCAVQHSAIQSIGTVGHSAFSLHPVSAVHAEPVAHAPVIFVGDHLRTVFNDRQRR